jgi:hypothetical protein
MSAVETLVRQLAGIRDQLIALPDDAFAERFELVRRQDELRSQAAEYAEGADRERLTEDLLAELASLRMHADAGATNRTMDDARSTTRIEARIGRIKGVLIGRGVDPR